MRRGEVWWVTFDHATGGEIKKTRPAVIVSNDKANRRLNRLQVVPLTSNTKYVFPSDALVEVQGKRSKALASQITTVAKERLRGRIDVLSSPDLAAVVSAVRIQLEM